MNPKKDQNKTFWIHPDDFDKIIKYAGSAYNQFKSEIGGQMIAVQDDVGDWILKDPVILKQEISYANCTMEASALGLHYSQMIKKHGKNVRHCWWHSHHTMKAFWSGTDDATILETPAKDWTVSLVVNLKKEYQLRVQFFSPFLHEVNVDLNFLEVLTENDAEVDKEVKQLCTNQVVKRINTYTARYNGSGIQTTMFPEIKDVDPTEDEADYLAYNASFGVYPQQEQADLSKMDEKTRTKYMDIVDKLTDEVSSAEHMTPEGFCNSKLWNKRIKKINKQLIKYNLRLKKFVTNGALDNAIIQYWTDDYFENINKPERMVN